MAAFAALMNRKAAELGCEDTWFITPNGLDATVEHSPGIGVHQDRGGGVQLPGGALGRVRPKAHVCKVKLYIQKGEQYTVRDLLHSLMLESHNDTAVALAESHV